MKVQNFSENLEKSLDRLGKEVEKNLESPEVKAMPEREVVKRSVQNIAKTLPPPAKFDSEKEKKKDVLPEYFKDSDIEEDAEQAVRSLVKTAMEEDLEKAIRDSKKHSAFVEDAFHDALVDKLVPELRNRGILK